MASSTLLSGPQRPFLKSTFLNSFRVRQHPNPRFPPPKSSISACSSSSPSFSEREEQRWLREEQRWLREEQRWLREESRWQSERESLLSQIADLRHRIEGTERRRAPEAPSVAPPLLAEEAEVKEMVLEGDVVRVSEDYAEIREETKVQVKKTMLRTGSEGEEVRAMQEALQKLGFYSGEEDMEFSCFSSGTERAVKTWQASLGAPEDGIMTSELLERLFFGGSLNEYDTASAAKVGGTNGAPFPPSTKINSIQRTVIKETGDQEFEVSDHKVFLLGENRWEEPSRLINRNNLAGGSKVVSATKCLTCRGEGRLLCTVHTDFLSCSFLAHGNLVIYQGFGANAECDGSGEPNIEPQFLEWVGEDSKCAYCEGLGYTICDVCEGKNASAKT
ncbi:peptidoglycan binding domain containing protein isoform X1 [Iris pallida]|uniref:Peptidoglycan binding domain containing protein isoform X1 n=1 Tax=Iris pallida TaxID=29817 RepID=A0AAX6H163_IRIPA|nr:peptidoglycan binding domain containing protein isoform X1 [Iris pallida]KAJ6834770.1 peptidoglycan binding domain containing protein isoform X1 [Iris pallida]